MPEFLRMVALFQERMEGNFKRSDALRALIWPNAGLLLALMGGLTSRAPVWILIVLVALLVSFMGLYGWAYVFFANTDSDALRSETYKLRKLAIEHGLIGDDRVGLLELPKPPAGLENEPETSVEEQ